MYAYDSAGTAQKIIVNPLTKKEPVIEAYGKAGYRDIIVNPLFDDGKKEIRENFQFEMTKKSMKNWCVVGIVFLLFVLLILLFLKKPKSSFGNPRFGYKFF